MQEEAGYQPGEYFLDPEPVNIEIAKEKYFPSSATRTVDQPPSIRKVRLLAVAYVGFLFHYQLQNMHRWI